MADRTLGKALREAGLKKEASKRIIENKDFAVVVVQVISLMSLSFHGKVSTYHGKADFSRLPQVMKEVLRNEGRIRDYRVAEGLGLSPRNFSNLLHKYPDLRIRYDHLRQVLSPTPG